MFGQLILCPDHCAITAQLDVCEVIVMLIWRIGVY